MTQHEEVLDSSRDWVAEHTRRYVETGGEDGFLWRGAPTLVLTTRGRRSGKLRRNALIFGQEGERYLLVASYGGSPKHPLWYLNLTDNPEVTVQVKGDTFTARARTAGPEEKPGLWKIMAGIWPAYDDYQGKTQRQIPLIILERS